MPFPQPAFASLSLLLAITISSMELPAIAQEYVPPQRGIPGRREGGGTRGNCVQGQKSFMPLIPANGFSVTVSANPTFFWFVPGTIAKTAEFVISDRQDQPLYRTAIALPQTPGIVSFTLPNTVTAAVLTPGKDYYWQFAVICDPEQPSRNLFVEGVVQRTNPTASLTAQLGKATTAHDRATIYARAGIWQDAITTLAQERCDRPQNATLLTSWTRLLRSVRLEDYAKEPLTNVCRHRTSG